MANAVHSIVAAVDFGEASGRAVAVAGFLAGRCHADMRLLHAESFDAPVYFTSEQVEGLEQQRQTLRTRVEETLTRFGRQHTTAPFTVTVDTRPAVEAILAESIGADLLVMGTHGRRGPERWWLGSVAERVLREVDRPLLIVRAGMNRQPDSLFERPLVHAPAPLAGLSALQFARNLAACTGGAEVVDERRGAIVPAIERSQATVVVAAIPHPRTAAWLSGVGEPLVRFSPVPILFVPEVTEEGVPA